MVDAWSADSCMHVRRHAMRRAFVCAPVGDRELRVPFPAAYTKRSDYYRMLPRSLSMDATLSRLMIKWSIIMVDDHEIYLQ